MAVIICNETQGSAESIQHIHFARAGLLPEAFTNIWQLNLAPQSLHIIKLNRKTSPVFKSFSCQKRLCLASTVTAKLATTVLLG